MATSPLHWPLPGQVDPNIMPCAFCRRRLRWRGRPVFRTCSCQAFGPPVTIAALVGGAVVVGLGLVWWRRR